jgi:hypothetical protein
MFAAVLTGAGRVGVVANGLCGVGRRDSDLSWGTTVWQLTLAMSRSQHCLLGRASCVCQGVERRGRCAAMRRALWERRVRALRWPGVGV